jgi:hypothetical protein
MTYNLEFALPLPITQTTIQIADRFANRQPTATKAAQVRLNTIAVCAVSDYLQMMGIATDPTASDSWNPVMQLCADVADLQVAGVGRLECRPYAASQLANRSLNQIAPCPIPPEVWESRIGYVVVQIDDASPVATLLGFVEQAAVEALPLSQLQPPEELLDHVDRLLHPVTEASMQALTNLGQWLQNQFESGWQAVESLLTPEMQLAYNFRGEVAELNPAIRRAKVINVGTQPEVRLLLVLEIESTDAEQSTVQQSTVRLQVYPSDNQVYLPAEVRLTILDESGAVFLEAISRELDNYIQLELSGDPGEQFSIQLRLGDETTTENFVM